MERIRLLPGAGKSSRRTGSRGVARWRDAEGDEGSAGRLLAGVHADDPKRRLALAGELRAATTGTNADPALRELLRMEHLHLKQMVADRGRARVLERSLRSLKRPLYPYQLTGVRRFFDVGRLLLADDMGLGKTVQAAAVCRALWKTGTLKRGLLIVPAHLKSQWRREWHAVTDAPLHIVDGTPAERAAIYRRQREGFLVANYEQVLRDLDLMHAWKPQLVVLDEAQRIKNWATKTATFVKQLRPPYRLVLTGTPMENRLDELASIMDWVDDQALEPKWRLAPWHSRFVDGTQAVGGARHLSTLRSRLSHCMLRRRRAEVLDQLPPRTDTVIPLELTEAQRGEHEALAQPIARLAHLARRRPLNQDEFFRLMSLLTTQRIVANGLAQLEFKELWPGLSSVHDPDESLLKSLSSPKLLELRRLVARVAVEQNRKIVVFSQWRRMLTLAHWATGGLLARHGLRAAFFTGQESQKRRTQNIVDFHDDDDTAILFATDAGGVGLNLQRAASCCINLELPWNPAVLEQRIARIHRLGQKRPIDVYNLVSQNCIESRIARIVADKRALFEGLFDGDSDEIVFDHSGNFLSRLEKVFEPDKLSDEPTTGTGDETGDETGVEQDGAAEREVEALLEAADETQDEPAGAGHQASKGRASAGEGGRRTLDVPAEVSGWFSQLEVRRTAEGGLKIEASEEAAEGLAAMFEGLASVLRKSASGGSER